LAISALAWLDITDNGAYCRSADQTPPADQTPHSEATRLEVYLQQGARVVSEPQRSPLRSVITEGEDSKQPFLRGVRALGLEHIGTLRLDANLRDLYQGPQRPGPGRPQPYAGKVHGDNLSQLETVETADAESGLSPQVLNHVQCQCHLRVVLVVATKHNRKAGLLSTDLPWDARPVYRSYKARCQIELLCRDATQCAGLRDCQARSQAQLNFHFHARLSAVTLAQLAARPPHGDAASGLSMARLKRRACNQHLLERISPY
jgi:hypothetical protein